MMPPPSQLPRVVRFGTFEVDVPARELRKNGLKLKLQEQPFQVLCTLLEHPGEVVTREELRGKLWPGDTFGDFDHGLNAAVKRLRDALGDDPDNPRFVETLARRGYRFIGNIGIPAATPPARPRSWQWLFNWKTAVLGGLAACALTLSFLSYSHSVRSKAGHPTVRPVVTPVVTNVGEKYTPSLSPDGQHIAFTWNGGAGPHFSIYVKIVGTEEPVRLTTQSSIDFNPVWSSDGRYIAFCRILKDETGIYTIPASGGAERRMHRTLWPEKEFYQAYWSAGRLSWSADGKYLAFSDRGSDSDTASSIFLLSLDSLEVSRVTRPLHSRSDSNPEFSPDGKTLAFAGVSEGVLSIYAVPVSGGDEQRLVSGRRYSWGLAWTPDGRAIVFRRFYLANKSRLAMEDITSWG